jgi:hypothetical protein
MSEAVADTFDRNVTNMEIFEHTELPLAATEPLINVVT